MPSSRDQAEDTSCSVFSPDTDPAGNTHHLVAGWMVPWHSTVHWRRCNAQQFAFPPVFGAMISRHGGHTGVACSPSTVAVIVVIVAGRTAPAASGAWSGPAGPLQWHRILFLLTDRISFPSLYCCRCLYHALLLLASAKASATPTARTSTGRNVRQACGNMGQRSGRHLVAQLVRRWCESVQVLCNALCTVWHDSQLRTHAVFTRSHSAKSVIRHSWHINVGSAILMCHESTQTGLRHTLLLYTENSPNHWRSMCGVCVRICMCAWVIGIASVTRMVPQCSVNSDGPSFSCGVGRNSTCGEKKAVVVVTGLDSPGTSASHAHTVTCLGALLTASCHAT